MKNEMYSTISAYQSLISSQANASFYYCKLGLRAYEHGRSASTGNYTGANTQPWYNKSNGTVGICIASWIDDGKGAFYQRPALYVFYNYSKYYNFIFYAEDFNIFYFTEYTMM